MNPKLEIRSTEKYGKGIFTKKDIRKGEMLFVMGGYIVTTEDENKYGDIVMNYDMDLSRDFSFSPLCEDDLDLMPQHYVNHSCNPNAGFKGQVFMIAMRKIKRGEEIVYDYSMVTLYQKLNKEHFVIKKCLCGSRKCRGIIKEDDWKISNLQKRYDGYFQWFIQEKINNIKK